MPNTEQEEEQEKEGDRHESASIVLFKIDFTIDVTAFFLPGTDDPERLWILTRTPFRAEG